MVLILQVILFGSRSDQRSTTAVGNWQLVKQSAQAAASACTTEPKATIGWPGRQLWRKLVVKKQEQNWAHENPGTMRTTGTHIYFSSTPTWQLGVTYNRSLSSSCWTRTHTGLRTPQKMKVSWQDLDLLWVWALPRANKVSSQVNDTLQGCRNAQRPPTTVRV